MTWRYSQSMGVLYHNRTRIDKGYSGKGNSKNNGADEALGFKGPIPRGSYSIGTPYYSTRLQHTVIPLTPIGHSAHGRTAFLIHGDNSTNTASEGCIIFNIGTRQKILKSRDKKLEVVQ
jgi:hypothetical protein